MKKINRKSLYLYPAAIILFIVLAYAYFPALFEGKIIQQSDISSWRGAANEIIEYRDKTGDEPLWTNSMFGGMPSTMITTDYKGNYLNIIYNNLFIGSRPASYLILAFVSFFLLMLAFGINVQLAILGSLAFGFCAYNFQILLVGHNAKMVAITFMPMVLAAIVYAFRKNRWLGALFFAFALAFEIHAGHPQITYYLAMIVIFYGLAQIYLAIKQKAIPAFLRTMTLLIIASLFAVGSDINHLWSTWEYGKYTMRGGSELTFNQKSQTAGGLDKEYATAWSYGVDETFNLFIPNYKGGPSYSALSADSETCQIFKQAGYPNAEQQVKQMPTYWGSQAFTAGPMYMGAISIFLFVLGLILVKGSMKWWIAGVSLLALLLGWGKHMMFFSDFFYDYVPLYNKFRVPSMILIILQLTIPLLGIYTLNELFFKKRYDNKTATKGLKVALGIVGGISLLFVLIPGIAGNFTSMHDQQLPDVLQHSLAADRKSLLRSDALRSLIFILLSAGTIWGALNNRLKLQYSIAILGALIVIDMWSIDKRYLNDSHFVTQKEFNNQYQPREVDKIILEDKDPYYRVLDITRDVFNDSHTSYYHKSIGGYSAAKLQRYQDIIEYCLAPEIQTLYTDFQNDQTLIGLEKSLSKQSIINMLNTKYVILSPNGSPIENRAAMGNAWFVKEYRVVDSADEELLGLKEIDPSESAIINKEFEHILQDKGFNFDEEGTIILTDYAPNRLEYRSSATHEQLALFSEVYYPKGWSATIDGIPTSVFRANYILRGLIVPEGEHTIIFEFKPDSYYFGNKFAAINSVILLLALAVAITFGVIHCYRKKDK